MKYCYGHFNKFTSIAVNLKNAHQHTTKILPFDLTVIFLDFPIFVKCSSHHAITKIIENASENQCLIFIRPLHHSQPNTNHVGKKRNSYILGVTCSELQDLTFGVYVSTFHFAPFGI